jgi:hypothetical protein
LNEKTVSPFSPVLLKVDNEGGVEKVSPFLNESEKYVNDKNVISQALIKAGDKEPKSKENCAPIGQLIQRKITSSSKSGSVLKIR